MTGPEIKALREHLGLSQAALADRLSVDGPLDVMTISRWERGQRTPPPYLRLALDHLACERVGNRALRETQSRGKVWADRW